MLRHRSRPDVQSIACPRHVLGSSDASGPIHFATRRSRMSFFGWKKSASAAGKGPQGKSLELIQYDTESGKFRVGEAALQVLQAVKGPVGVVAVSGRARQGKSFILNQLLGQTSGFTVGPTHRPCTKGLWMWSAPVERNSPDGSKYHLVMLDTEGIDAYDQTGQYSTQIFSLAVLLSSLFVYNQMGGIDEAALDRLSLVTEMTKHIRVKSGDSAGVEQLAEFTPSFLWLLRDFYLTLEEDGHKITPREYLETALRPLSGAGPSVEAKNQIRDSIKQLFPNRDCFCLVRPHNDEKQLAQLESLPGNQLRREFTEGLERLTKVIFARALPKRLGNHNITGPMLAVLATQYVEAINQGAVPTIATAWQGVAEAECRRAADAAEAAYAAAVNTDVPPDEVSLDREHARCMAIAHQAYAEAAVGEESIRLANQQRYQERLQQSFQARRQERLASAEVACRRVISEHTAHISQLGSQQGTTAAQLRAAKASFEAEYRRLPSPQWQLMGEFARVYDSVLEGFQERQRREEASQAAAAAAEADRRAEQAQGHAQSLKQQNAKLHDQAQQAQQQLEAAQRRIAELESQVQRLQRELQAAQTQLEGAKQQQLQAGHQAADVERLQQQVQQLQAQLAQEQQQHQQQLQAAQARMASMEQQAAQAPAAPEAAPMDMDADDFQDAEDQADSVNPEKKTIAQLKTWLTEAGHEEKAFELASKRAKKPEYVKVVKEILGQL